MEIIRGIDELRKPLENPVVTLGNFDGVHLGHQEIFRRVKREAVKIRGESVVLTFEPHPLKVLFPERCPPLLTPFRKKIMLIERSGMDVVLCIEFTKAFSELSPSGFVENILAEKLRANRVIIGYNYHFGKNKGGDPETLKALGAVFRIDVDVVEPLLIDGMVVSSSRIRKLIKEGEVEAAARLLGRDYPIMGKVIEGARRGRTLGFPTANVDMADEDLYPKPGVYAVGVLWNGQSFYGVANIGVNPTFQPTEKVSVEVYILDFDRSIYGDEIQVNFKKRIRDEIRFESTGDLINQIQRDVEWAEENVFRK